MSDRVIFAPTLIEAFERVGVPYPDELEPEPGKLLRFPTNGRRDDLAGWLRVFHDQDGAVFGNWRSGESWTWQRERDGPPPDPAELAAIRQRADEARQQAEAERESGHREAARKAAATWAASEPASEHAYSTAKGIKPYVARQRNGWLVIPVFDGDGNIQSVQSIDPTGKKLFLPGGRMAGGRCWIGEPDDAGPILLAEGYATGCTLHEATGWPVCVCFTAGNLRAVACNVRERFPLAKLIVAGDNDRHTDGNPGAAKAKEAARLVRAAVVLPSFDDADGTDFNDVARQAGLDEVRRQIQEMLEPPPKEAPKQKARPNLQWVQSFVLSQEEKAMLTDPEWVYRDLLVQGHVVAIIAEPNGGKTTIMAHVAGEIADRYEVFYVNADTAGSDAKAWLAHAEAHGYTMLLPDMKAGLSMDDVVQQLIKMNEVEADYSGIVFVFDTLKKMTEVINKSKARALYQVLRGLSAKGMTVVLLGHTNKYYDDNGRPIYEGTADLRADIDELIYFIPQKHTDGSMTVSSEPDKRRADVKPITFQIDADRTVKRLGEYIDTMGAKKAEMDREKDEIVIEAITDALRAGKSKQTEIGAHCKEAGIGLRSVTRALKKYARPPLKLWTREKGFEKNTWVHALIDE
jgi:phage/plasmid primase-like uncharacterized protein